MRRRMVGSLVLLACPPLLFAVAVAGAAVFVPFGLRLLDMVWPWVAGLLAVVVLWRLVVRRF